MPAIIARKGLLVEIDIEILALIIFDILNVPYPILNRVISVSRPTSLESPLIYALAVVLDPVSPFDLGPLAGNVLRVTSTDCTAPTCA